MSKKGKITERTLYPHIIEIIKQFGGSGITEVQYNSEPDVVFNFKGYQWLMSVKIGESTKIIKDSFVQYFRHRRESGIEYGMIVFFPEEIRKVKPIEDAVRNAVKATPITCLVDTPDFQSQVKDSLPKVFEYIEDKIARKIVRTYPLNLVVSLLRQHIEDMMKEIELTESQILEVITDPNLFFGIGGIKQNREDVLRFLATYIILSQLLFLRLYSAGNPEIMKDFKEPTKKELKEVFDRVQDINYKPIYEIDVLDFIPDEFVEDAFDLIWGLKIEGHRHEIPGRLFHELMPERIRKLLAAFYTRPIAADLLANLTIEDENDTVLDPACGSGTILTAAYRIKAELTDDNGKKKHKQFCEKDIFGVDIMPFAVHLTTANLAAMNPEVTIEMTQIVEGDSLKIAPKQIVKPGIRHLQLTLSTTEAYKRTGEKEEIELKRVKAVLMNPPFTKVERGIREYIDTSKFEDLVGGEVGLWGYFIPLADSFLEDNGVFGAVLPINILRGRESYKVREFVFNNWTPLYIIKPTFNYGFTEYAEYRDILLIAKKKKSENYCVKFCLVKKDLNELSYEDIKRMADAIKRYSKLRSNELDIETFSKEEIFEHFINLMWFIGVSDFEHRDILVEFLKKFNLDEFPDNYFREGYRPVPRGVSKFMFITRPVDESRIQQAFLRLKEERGCLLNVETNLGVEYKLRKDDFLPTLRTPVGLKTMSIEGKYDYVAKRSYKGINDVFLACGFKRDKLPDNYWSNVSSEMKGVRTNLVVSRRINPYSPNTHLIAFYSDTPIYPSNQLNVIQEIDKNRAKAVCILLNSAIFLSYFFLLKEETTGRYIDIRFYDLYEMNLYPPDNITGKLAKIFDKYSNLEFPCLRNQLDVDFDGRYKSFWKEKRKGQKTLIDFEEISPHQLRIKFDMDVARALDVDVSEKELKEVYAAIVKEMIITRGLRRD